MKSEDGLGIEYDETVICDVCRSPDSEEANEMVFCDSCNICVHQACYGITTIPSGNERAISLTNSYNIFFFAGQWLCRTCSMGQKPDCVLCPNKGGAMKSTRSGQKWAHVSCALWIPEVSIGSVDRMEPITKISSIPQSRWALVCVLCRERVGACIQCSVKTCKIAYHVTCAFQHGLEMRAIIEDENAEDGVKLRSYCQKHSVKKEPKNSANSEKASASEDDDATKTTSSAKTSNTNKTNKKKIRKEMTSEERSHARRARLMEIQSEFAKHVSIKDISCHLLDVDQEGINSIYNYWILKRKASGNEPLLPPKAGDVDVLSQTDQEQADIEKMKMFVHLRQDLERVRNLCYMVSRREKLSRSFFKMREQIFHKQVSILTSHKKTTKLDDNTLKAILEANHGPSIYDVLYSSDAIKDSRVMRIDEMIDSILGNNLSASKSSSSPNKTLLEINGNVKREKMDAITRYSKLFNGGTTTTTGSNRKYSSYDSLSSDTDGAGTRKQARKSHRIPTSQSSSEEEVSPIIRPPSRKSAPVSPAKSKILTSPTTPTTATTPVQNQPKKKGRPLGSTKQAAAEKRKQTHTHTVKDKLNKSLSVDSSTEDEDVKHLPQIKSLKSPLSTRNRLPTEDHLTDESDELVPIKNSSGHSIPTTQGGTVKRMHSSAIYSDSDSSSTDKDNRTDHTVSDSQLQPFRTKAAMKEFNENELLLFASNKPTPPAASSKKSSDETKKSAMPNKKSSSIQSPTQSKRPNLPPPVPALKKESVTSNKATKSRRMSTKPQNNLTSESESEDVTPTKKSTSNITPSKKDINLADFLVVPQRVAAKKASENLMKTTSNLMVQSIGGGSNEKKKDPKEKLDEVVAATKAALDSVEMEKQKDTKSKQSSSSKTSNTTKDKSKSEKKSQREEKKEISKKEEINVFADISPADIPIYVPQRQAAKKAAEHIKGINSSTIIPVQTAVGEEKPKPIASAGSKKSMPDRRKSTAVDLSSSSTSSSSSSDSSSDSESGSPTPKQKAEPTTKNKSLSTRRASTATGAKQKAKELPFLDKAAKSSAHVESSSSSASSDESDSSSDRPNTSRLPEKGSKNKRKSTDQSASTGKKTSVPAPTKKSVATKKEVEKPSPTRRLSIATTKAMPPIPSSSKATKSPQKSSSESTKPEEISTPSPGKRSVSSVPTTPVIASPTPTSTLSKVSDNNKSRTTESSKRDVARLHDKRKSSDDVKEIETPTETKQETTDNKRRRSSILSPTRQISKESKIEKEKQEIKENLDEIKSKENDVEKPSEPKEVITKSMEVAKPEEILPTKKLPDVDSSEMKMDIDETISLIKPTDESSKLSPKIDVPLVSPMISIPNVNLNATVQQDKNLFTPTPPSSTSSMFDLTNKNLNSEDTERETYSLIEKLRQKNKKNSVSSDSNSIVSEKPSCMRQNENTPKQDEQPASFKPISASPILSPRKDSNEPNDLKKSSSPWHQQSQLMQNQIGDNNYQRNILTSSSCNNKMNLSMESQTVVAPASCMVVEQQQKQQLSAIQRQKGLELENSNMRQPPLPFSPAFPVNDQLPNNNHIDQLFNMQLQQSKWQEEQKSMKGSQHHENIIKRSSTSGMENMMNSMNQQSMKNFTQHHKSPNDFTATLQQQNLQQAGNFNSYNFPDVNSAQFPGPVSLFPSDFNIQVPLPSPGQAMFPPNISQNAPFTQQQQQLPQNNDQAMMIHTSNIQINNKDMHFRSQNICSTAVNENSQQHFNQQRTEIQLIPEVIIKKSPSKSTRSSPRNANMTPTYITGAKTPQKSPSKSPRQPSTPASVESLSRQNSQKGKSTPNSSSEGKQRKSRTNSQASPADHRGNKGRPRNSNKNTKGRFPSNAMPFIPFNSDIDYIAIDKKLVGTVYDFNADEEFATNPTVENLRTMRDRRKSIDFHGKMNRDGSSQSPKFSKTPMKSSTPLTHPLALNNHTLPNTVVNESETHPVTPSITSINLVNMPGPVDMRTYNSFDNTNDSYNSQLLGAFATNTVDQTLEDINEEQEKELQTALKASNDKQKTPTTSSTTTTVSIETKTTEITNIVEESVDSEASYAKVSLSDSRNQLKLKIKGPLAHHHHDIQSASVVHAQIAPQISSASSAATASSNRRQMRKKELLQQYWNQGNVESEPSASVSQDQQTSSNVSLNRVGGIPKAVDSMRLELLKDEFQDFNYAEYKKRKRFAYKSGGDPHVVDVEMSASNDTQSIANEMDPLAIEGNNKKRRNQRGRQGQQQQSNASTTAQPPKLKIKIGTDIMETTGSDLPPKKRLIAQPPSYQDLKRESMNFRKQMMDSFSEEKTQETRTKSEKEKRKKVKKKDKKKDKKRQSVEIVSQPITEGAPVKLILKFGSKSSSLNTSATSDSSTAAPQPPAVVEQLNKSTPPLKLKLSRSTGNGEYNILNTPQKKKSMDDCTGNNNNVQVPANDSIEKQIITTKKLEITLERIDDIEKAKLELSNKHTSNTSDQKEDSTKNCQVR